jgi:hypothetical protein
MNFVHYASKLELGMHSCEVNKSSVFSELIPRSSSVVTPINDDEARYLPPLQITRFVVVDWSHYARASGNQLRKNGRLIDFARVHSQLEL